MSHVSVLLDGLAVWTAGGGLVTYRSDGSAYLASETALTFKDMPEAPDRVVCLTAYGAFGDEPVVTLGRQPVQVKVRGNADDSLDVDVIADAIFDQWHAASNLTFGGLHVVQILRSSSIPLGMDQQSRRWMRADNYQIDLDYPTTGNRPV